MSELSPLEQEVAKLIVETLNLEDIGPESIAPEAPLFKEGLGLDSIDALELSLGISLKYGFQIKSGDSNNTLIFSNLRSLSQHIENQRKT
jgi:acyl carrier protein